VSPRDRRTLTAAIKDAAREIGFDKVGVARAEHADPDARLRAWLDAGYAGTMSYMARGVAEREDPRRLVPGARSVIALATSYYAPEGEAGARRIARYARGDDYHRVLTKKTRKLRRRILELAGAASIKPVVDTAPVLEREWAQRAGIAWIGKSTMAIAPELGTYTFLAALITDLDLEPDEPHPDRCGTCTLCLEACPTDAFVAPYVLDARRCITHWTVETREAFDEATPPSHGWVAGCDVCQEVCPWNKFAKPTSEPRFQPRPELLDPPLDGLDEARAAALIEGTALQRTGAAALVRNARHAR